MFIQKIQYLSDFILYLNELFPAYICANNIASLVNNLFGVKIFNPFISFTSSSPFSGGMSDKYTGSSLSFFLLHLPVLHLRTNDHNYIFQEVNQ